MESSGIASRRWTVDIELSNGIIYLQSVGMDEVKDAIKLARRSGVEREERPSVPLEPWVMDIAVEDVFLSYPGMKILSMEITQS